MARGRKSNRDNHAADIIGLGKQLERKEYGRYRAKGPRIQAAAAHWGISTSMVYRWLKAYGYGKEADERKREVMAAKAGLVPTKKALKAIPVEFTEKEDCGQNELIDKDMDKCAHCEAEATDIIFGPDIPVCEKCAVNEYGVQYV